MKVEMRKFLKQNLGQNQIISMLKKEEVNNLNINDNMKKLMHLNKSIRSVTRKIDDFENKAGIKREDSFTAFNDHKFFISNLKNTNSSNDSGSNLIKVKLPSQPNLRQMTFRQHEDEKSVDSTEIRETSMPSARRILSPSRRQPQPQIRRMANKSMVSSKTRNINKVMFTNLNISAATSPKNGMF